MRSSPRPRTPEMKGQHLMEPLSRTVPATPCAILRVWVSLWYRASLPLVMAARLPMPLYAFTLTPSTTAYSPAGARTSPMRWVLGPVHTPSVQLCVLQQRLRGVDTKDMELSEHAAGLIQSAQALTALRLHEHATQLSTGRRAAAGAALLRALLPRLQLRTPHVCLPLHASPPTT